MSKLSCVPWLRGLNARFRDKVFKVFKLLADHRLVSLGTPMSSTNNKKHSFSLSVISFRVDGLGLALWCLTPL